MKAVIIAGGLGTRISKLYPNIPKPMIPINNKPVLEYMIENLAMQGVKDIIITISYLGDVIEGYFGDGSQYGICIKYYHEKCPLGNAGALFKMRGELGDEPFLLLNGDLIFDISIERMVAFHNAHGAKVTLLTHPNNHPYDSGLVVADEKQVVLAWLSREDKRPKYYKNNVNSGIHIINPSVLDEANVDVDKIGVENEAGNIVKVDLDRHLLKPLAGTGMMYSYKSSEYVKDMGTPERLKLVEMDWNGGLIAKKNMQNKQKAIFLDRDGIINKYIDFLSCIDDFELIDGVATAIRKINASGDLCIVVTNQPVIARGELTLEGLNEIHNKMETLLGNEGAYVDDIFYCPHHPDKGFPGEIARYKCDCMCRKPNPGMLFAAAEKYNIDLSESWMVGDSVTDVLAGKNAGCKTCYVGEMSESLASLSVRSLCDFVNEVYATRY